MKTFLSAGLFLAVAMTAGAVEPAAFQSGPKNLVAPTYRARAASARVNKPAAAATSAGEHLSLARYYLTEAEKLDAKSAAYAEAAAAYRHGPMIKNFMAPSAPAGYEFLAKKFREDAKSDRALSASHERMAQAFASR